MRSCLPGNCLQCSHRFLKNFADSSRNNLALENKVASLSQEVIGLRAQLYTGSDDLPRPARLEISSSSPRRPSPPTHFETGERRPEKRRATDDGSDPANRARQFRNEINKRQAMPPPVRPPLDMQPPPIPMPVSTVSAQRRDHEREGGEPGQGQNRSNANASYQNQQVSHRAATAGSVGRSQQYFYPSREGQVYGRPPGGAPMRAGPQSYPGPSTQMAASRIETPRHPGDRFAHPSLRAGSALPPVRAGAAHPTQWAINAQNPSERLGTGIATNKPFKPHFPQPPEYPSGIARGQREDYAESLLNRRPTGAGYRGNVVPQPLWEDALRTPVPSRGIGPTQIPTMQRSGVGLPRYDGDRRVAQPGVARDAEEARSVISPFFSGSPPPRVSNQSQTRGQASVILPRHATPSVRPTFRRGEGISFGGDPRESGFETPIPRTQSMYRSRDPTQDRAARGEVISRAQTQAGVGRPRQGVPRPQQRGGKGARLGDLLGDNTRGGDAAISGGPGLRQSSFI